MNKWLQIVVAVVALSLGVIGTSFADPVDPANVELTCLRNAGSASAVTTTTFYQGDTVSLTNSVMYTGSDTNSAVQNLSGCTITVVAGQPGATATQNVEVAGSAIVEADGTWTAEFTCPPYNPCYIQVTVSNNAVFTYPRYRINTQEKLTAP